MRPMILIGAVLISGILVAAATAGEATSATEAAPRFGNVLPAEIDGVAPKDMMKAHLLKRVDAARQRWEETYATLTTPEAMAAYQTRLRAEFQKALGSLPERTPLNPRVTGVLERDGYRVEKILFESRPAFYVTAALFLPDPAKHKPPYAGVLVPCGHAANAKASESYQTMGASLALHGMAALVYDPIDQGERFQLLDGSGKPLLGGTTGHTMVGVACMLLGRNVAQIEVWDGMRALDYLSSRPEIDPSRIGITGNSGGGTQTSQLMPLDERIKVAAASCYLTNMQALLHTIGPQDAEQNIFGQLAFGMDHADYILMRAPAPFLICAATKDFFDIAGTWETYRFAKRLYTRMGFAERVDLMENDAGHNYNELQRQSVLRWMARWLNDDASPLTEPKIAPIPEKELYVTPAGQVMLLEGARSAYDFNLDEARDLATRRAAAWSSASDQEKRERIRAVTGIRPLAEIPEPRVEESEDGQRLVVIREDGVRLPAIVVNRDAASSGIRLVIHERGKAAALDGADAAGSAVCGVDVRGTGETLQTDRPWGGEFGPNLKECFMAYLLGTSYVGMRTEDILVCAREAARHAPNEQIELVATGNVGVPALHAAALEPQLFASVTVARSLPSWSNVIESRRHRDQLVNAVHGVLQVYDLPDLTAMLGDKLQIKEPLDARGEPWIAP